MDQNLQRLAQYVGQQLRQGETEQNIRAALVQNKWTQDWISAAFNVVRQNPGMFGLVTAQQPFPSSTPQQRPADPAPAYAQASVEQPIVETEQKQSEEAKPKSKRLWLTIVSAVVLLALAIGAYFLLQPSQDAPSTDTKQAQQEPPAPEKSKDEQRKDDLNTMLSNMADYYVTHKYYPTLTDMRDATFLSQNPTIDSKAFVDPSWTVADACNTDNRPTLTDKSTPRCYAYQATTQDGAVCDNTKVFCTKLRLTITLDDGKPYTIALHANTQVEN